MLHDGTVLFLANYVYTLIAFGLCAGNHSMNCDFFLLVCCYRLFELCLRYLKPKDY